MTILNALIQFAFILLAAPLASGLVRFFKARFQGRKGAPPFLPYYTLATLLKKEMVFSKAASWVFSAAPFAVLASALGFAFLVPTIFHGAALAGMSDFFLIAGILMIGSIFLVLGGLDPGSAFGGMGSSREMTMAAILEPTLIVVFATFAFVSRAYTVNGMLSSSLISANPLLWIAIGALVFLALGENARYPVDNPATHLELTMIHEAMILEYSGPFLAMMEYASAIKMTVFAFLIGNFILPASLMPAVSGLGDIIAGLLIGLLKIGVVMFLLALLESTIVKMRFYRMSEYASAAFFTAIFGLASVVIMRYAGLKFEYYIFFAALAVFLSVFLFGSVRIRSAMRYYVLTSLAIAGVAASLGVKEGTWHLFFFAGGTILVKVILVPILFSFIIRHKRSSIGQLQSFLRPASTYFLAAIVLAVTFFVIKNIAFLHSIPLVSVLYAAIALVMLGVMKMVVNRNVLSQIIGLLVLENGLALFTLVTVKTFPIVIEMGIFIITLISVFILSKLSASIRQLHGTLDTEELRNLTD